jgi:hypothetical protein
MAEVKSNRSKAEVASSLKAGNFRIIVSLSTPFFLFRPVAYRNLDRPCLEQALRIIVVSQQLP